MRTLPLLFSFAWSLPAETNFFAGAAGGIATLSGDARSTFGGGSAAFSLYKPENGPLWTGFAGAHLSEYLSVQASHTWNSNDLALAVTGPSGAFEQARSSRQLGVAGDLMVYFRNRRSWIRPYLAPGIGVVHFRSRARELRVVLGAPAVPPAEFSSTGPEFRASVGVDVRIGRGWSVRYSFLEAIRSNDVSQQLSPRGERKMATFENLFGFVKTWR